MSDEIPPEEKNIAIKRINSILNEFEDSLKIAENLYEDAVKKGAGKIQKEIQKKMAHVHKLSDSMISYQLLPLFRSNDRKST